MKLLSIVVPCYNEEEALPYFYEEITKISDSKNKSHGLSFEYIFIDDGSKDNTVNILKDMATTDRRV